jgi:hypothetical protein
MMCLRLSISPAQALAKARARFVGENAQGREGIWEGDEIVRGAAATSARCVVCVVVCCCCCCLRFVSLGACNSLRGRRPPARPGTQAQAKALEELEELHMAAGVRAVGPCRRR